MLTRLFRRALDKNHCICINYIKEKGLNYCSKRETAGQNSPIFCKKYRLITVLYTVSSWEALFTNRKI